MGTASNQIPAKNSNVQSDPDEEIRRRLEKLKAPGMNKIYIYLGYFQETVKKFLLSV